MYLENETIRTIRFAKRRRHRALIGGIFLTASMWAPPVFAMPETLLTPAQARDMVTVENVTVNDDVIAGTVINKSSHPIRDVDLLVRHLWTWRNEFRPGEDNRSRADYYRVQTEIGPESAVPFKYEFPRPLSSSAEGYFDTSISVAGFTEVIQ